MKKDRNLYGKVSLIYKFIEYLNFNHKRIVCQFVC